LVIVSAPSGCGKTTIVDRLLKRHPDWVRSISMTTRQPRPGEKDGEDYYFVTPRAFKETYEKGGLLESAKVYDYCYGTPKKFVDEALAQGKKVILAIDVQGAKKIKKIAGGKKPLLTLFILPPSVKVLRERLEGRNTESPAEVQHRIEVAQDEIKEAGSYDLAFVNQNLEQTVLEIEEGIEKFQKAQKGV
jgi:guanylate kinase